MVDAPILLPLDGSPLAEAALPYAEAIATAFKAPLVLLCVVDVEPARALPIRRAEELQQRVEELRRGPVQEYLDRVAADAADRGFTASTAIVAGQPAEQILAVAEQLGAGMIVMATHGRGGARRWLVGSVADQVMRLSPRPTLLVRPPDTAEPRRDVKLQRLMAPLDGSPLAEQALPPARRLATATGASLILVRVEPLLAALVGPEGATYDFSRIDLEVAAAAEKYLRTVRFQVPGSLLVTTRLLRGEAAHQLTVIAREEAIDLIVMTTRGRGGLDRLLLGSTADRMVRAGLPVLLIHPGPPSPDGQRTSDEG